MDTELFHERVDDVPLLLGQAEQLHLAEILDRHLGRHSLHQGLSPGQLATGWIAHVLSQSDHTKLHVRDWANSLAHTLGHFFGQPLRDTDFSDDRLGVVLRRLAEADWHALEADLYACTCDVYELPERSYRLDSTTVSGHHEVSEDGLMQFGASKDHRPDLPQLKLMAAAAEPAGHVVVSSVHPGCAADDPLYAPLIDRIDRMIGEPGLLFTGDCKMTSLATRAFVVARGHFYLGTLARNGQNGAQIDAWAEDLLAGRQACRELVDADRCLGLAGEFTRELSASADGRAVTWLERVQLIRPEELWQRQRRKLLENLQQAQEALWRLTPPVAVGQKQIKDEQKMAASAEGVLRRHGVEGLLEVGWQRQETAQHKQIGPGRKSPTRATREEVKVRYQITRVERDEAAIARRIERLAWRVQVSNLEERSLDLLGCVLAYRQGWCLEQEFHLVKSPPLSLGPLWVWKEDQLEGLTRLLLIALRLLTLLQLRVREEVAEEAEALTGTYSGQAGRRDERPTALRLLGALARAGLTLTRLEQGGLVSWHLSKAPALLEKLLRWLDLPADLYTRLTTPPTHDPTTPHHNAFSNSS
jgi:transposase